MTRPSVARISRESAAKTALAVIDAHGLEKFNLVSVARELGVSAPSLYHHFRDKSELLQEVARFMLGQIREEWAPGQSFEDRIISRCVATRRTLLRHPHAAVLILRFFPRHLLLDAYDRAVSAAPYPNHVRIAVIDAIEKYTFGAALFEASARAREMKPMPDVDHILYPSLSRAIADNPFDDEQLFIASLRLFLAGADIETGPAICRGR